MCIIQLLIHTLYLDNVEGASYAKKDAILPAMSVIVTKEVDYYSWKRKKF